MVMTPVADHQILKRKYHIFTSGGIATSDTMLDGHSRRIDSKLNGPCICLSLIQENTPSAHNPMTVQECGLTKKKLSRTGVSTEEERDTERSL